MRNPDGFTMLEQVHGTAVARRAWNYLLYLLRRQRASWPWLSILLRRNPGTAAAMLTMAAEELCLYPAGTDLFTIPEGGDRTPHVAAWSAATSWAWGEWSLQQRAVLVPFNDLLLTDLADADNDDEPLSPRLCTSGLTLDQLDLLYARGAGLTFAEMGRLWGKTEQNMAGRWRTAVRRLVVANPWLVERFGEVPWPTPR